MQTRAHSKKERLPANTLAASGEARVGALTETLARLDWAILAKAADILEKAWRTRRRIFVAGNGTSAAAGSQFALHLGWGRRGRLSSLCAVTNLAADSTVATAIANDNQFGAIFAEQLRGQMGAEDVLLLISGSGNSANVVAAAKTAKAQGGIVMAFLGFDGGALRGLADVAFVVPAPPGAYPLVEAAHHVALDILAEHVTEKFTLPSRGDGEAKRSPGA